MEDTGGYKEWTQDRGSKDPGTGEDPTFMGIFNVYIHSVLLLDTSASHSG